MAKNTQLSNSTVNKQADGVARDCDNGYIYIYGGTQATNAETAVGAQPLLGTLRFAATSAPAAAAGVLTFNAIASATATGTGTATWFRVLKADNTTVVFDGTVDIAANNPNMVIQNTAVASGTSLSVTSANYSIAKSATGF